MSSSRKNSNRFVSSSALTKSERHEISLLLVVQDNKRTSHGNSCSAVWSYYGKLCYQDNDPSSIVIDFDDDYRCCRLCLEREQELYKTNKKPGHISRVQKYSKTTGTSSMIDHLFVVHNVDLRRASATASGSRRQLSIQQSLAAGKDRDYKPAETEFEFSRDLCRMICVDLMPFSIVSGFREVCLMLVASA
jgi:hypothetical protein